MNYGVISAVEPDSPAELAGFIPGDLLISINEKPINDIIDYRFHTAESILNVVILRGNQQYEVEIEKDIDEPLGLEFNEELFDGIKSCDNCCIFCFVHQLPRGMRKSLYVRDDDYRLSFLHGNFITLASTSDEDIQRIITQRLSPMYISVHATDENLRRKMLCNPNAPAIMPRLTALAEARITLHTQVVLCPGWNDDSQLDKTIEDLASLYPSVGSIAVVPVGLTKHRRQQESLAIIDSDFAAATLAQIRRWQKHFQSTLGLRLVYASDELYLTAGKPVPAARSYEGFPQIENGVGLVRKFLDNAIHTTSKFPQSLQHPLRASLVTGESAGPILERFAQALNSTNGLDLKVEVIKNDFFGDMVTVTGLLTGADVIVQLEKRNLGDVIILPSICLRDGLFLDDVPVSRMEEELGVPVEVVAPRPSAVARRILELSR